MRVLIGLLLSCAAACAETWVVVEKVAGQVGFYSPEGKRVAGVKVGTHPHEIVLSRDGKQAYVSDNGILWMTYAGEGGNTISIVDVKARTKVGVIDLGKYRRPHGMTIVPKTGQLLATTENPDGLVLVDPVAKKVLRFYDVKGADPHMVMLGPGAEYAYASNTGTGTVAAVHLASGTVKLIKVDARPQGGVLSADGKLLYITNSEGNSISIIDTAKNERVGTIATGQGPGRVVLTPDGKTLVYNLQQGSGAGFADVATRKEIKRISLPGKPLSLTTSPDGKFAYAGLQAEDKIAVISIGEQRLVRVVDTPKGAGPDPVLVVP
jgi:YVTN family beta-propeller protein